MSFLEIKNSLSQAFIPILTMTVFLGIIIVVVSRLAGIRNTGVHYSFLFCFGILGGTSGLIAGVSKEPIVGGLLTGLLGIISALLSYLFSKESAKQFHNHIPFAISFLVLNALAGLSIGGGYKSKWDEFDRNYKEWLLQYEKVELEVLKQQLLDEQSQQSTNVATPSRTIEQPITETSKR